jgi:aminopeptidase N
LGDRLFWAGIKHFSREHAGGVVESRDFQVSLEKASGRNLNQPFQDWLYGSSSIALPVS